VGRRKKDLTEMARILGKARWKGVPSEERKRLAREAVAARWNKATPEEYRKARERMAKARRKRWPSKKRSKGS